MRHSSSSKSPEVLIIGIGNEDAGDDAAGRFAARILEEKLGDGATVIEASGEGAALMEAWENAPNVIVVDAVRSGAEPGRVHRLEASQSPIPAETFRASTHAFGLYEAVELARVFGRLPRFLTIIGIEGENFAAGAGISAAVRDGLESAVRMTLEEVEAIKAKVEG